MTELELIQRQQAHEQKRKDYELMRWTIAQKASIKPLQASGSPVTN